MILVASCPTSPATHAALRTRTRYLSPLPPPAASCRLLPPLLYRHNQKVAPQPESGATTRKWRHNQKVAPIKMWRMWRRFVAVYGRVRKTPQSGATFLLAPFSGCGATFWLWRHFLVVAPLSGCGAISGLSRFYRSRERWCRREGSVVPE